ncbi:PPE family protein [Mycobacterium sp. 1465703.0]|uniref:PPE family protein n=1 Tax=Mycobacterium sp. 1465703.0 TaxID=1834078 RepID=UPI0009F208E4|nr:PPE family protein [Mycobacterium sp. 1465703.0]
MPAFDGVAVDFWAPPEITSALIHSGPGPGSLLTAANAWRQLAIELGQAAASYASIVAGIPWYGPSATAMTASTLPYVAWMHTTSLQAAQMSTAADAMISAFAVTQAAVVHPSVVTANRTLLAHLIATNVFGVNFPAIAATEAQYLQMWAANTTALLSYQATSRQTMAMPTFSPPSPMTTPTAPAVQTAAVARAAAAPAAAADPAALTLPTDPIFSNPTVSALINQEASVVQSGFPFNLISSFTGGHDFMPGQYPDILAATPRNLAIAYNLTGPEAVGGAPNLYAPATAAAETSAVESSVTASLGDGMYVGNLVVPPSAVTSPIQLAAAQAPLVATTAEGTPLIPMFVPPMPPGARKAQRDRPDEKGYGPPIPGTIMRPPPSGG